MEEFLSSELRMEVMKTRDDWTVTQNLSLLSKVGFGLKLQRFYSKFVKDAPAIAHSLRLEALVSQ